MDRSHPYRVCIVYSQVFVAPDQQQANAPEQETEMDTTNVEPQPAVMEVASQNKLEWLCNKKVMTSNFEATLDGLVGDGQSIIMEFVDWTSSGPTYDFNDLQNALCGEAKLCFNADDLYLYGLAYTARESKKMWISRTIDLVEIEFQRHPDNLDNLLDFDKDASTFYFQQSLSINAINKETQSIDRKAHLFWEIPTIDAKINELMSTLFTSGKAAARLQMAGDSKDARNFFIIKKEGTRKRHYTRIKFC